MNIFLKYIVVAYIFVYYTLNRIMMARLSKCLYMNIFIKYIYVFSFENTYIGLGWWWSKWEDSLAGLYISQIYIQHVWYIIYTDMYIYLRNKNIGQGWWWWWWLKCGRTLWCRSCTGSPAYPRLAQIMAAGECTASEWKRRQK